MLSWIVVAGLAVAGGVVALAVRRATVGPAAAVLGAAVLVVAAVATAEGFSRGQGVAERYANDQYAPALDAALTHLARVARDADCDDLQTTAAALADPLADAFRAPGALRSALADLPTPPAHATSAAVGGDQ